MKNHDPASEYAIRFRPFCLRSRKTAYSIDFALGQCNMFEISACVRAVAFSETLMSALGLIEKNLTSTSALKIENLTPAVGTLRREAIDLCAGICVSGNYHIAGMRIEK